jgi:hypothetical protein
MVSRASRRVVWAGEEKMAFVWVEELYNFGTGKSIIGVARAPNGLACSARLPQGE